MNYTYFTTIKMTLTIKQKKYLKLFCFKYL